MKTILMVALTLMGFATLAQPIVNAGADQIIYLTQTNSATLDGSASSGTSYQWREISTDFSSGSVIASPTSKTTTISGLKQGTFYFELSATTGGITKRDSTVIRVDNEPPPSGSSIANYFQMDNSNILKCVNWRQDTTSFFPDRDQVHSQCGDAQYPYDASQWWILYRDRVNAIEIDSLRGKLKTKIEDGYGVGSNINGTQVPYPRTEVVVDKPGSIDTNHIYMYEWKGYFPQQTNYLTDGLSITTIFQIHTNSLYGENTSDFSLKADGTIVFTLFPNGSREEKFAVGNLSDWTNKSHTIRLTIREGYGAVGNPAFIKLDIDGKQMLMRDTGRIGGTVDGDFGDFAKFATLYDASNAMVDANQPGRGRKFSLVTESFKRYTLATFPPLTNAGKNQIVTLPATSGTLRGTVTPVTANIASYEWTKVSGTNAVITNPNSLSTTVTNLSEGTYIFNLKAIDVNGLESNSTVQFVVDTDRTIGVSGYNYDVLVDGVLNGSVSSLVNHDIDGFGYSFYASGFSPNSTPLPSQYGLPTDGVIISPTNTRYKLQPYNQNNALWLNTGKSGTLNLNTQSKFDKIKIAITGGETPVNYQVNYSDNSYDIGSLNVPDWNCRGCTGYVINNLGRIDVNGAIQSTYWAIHEDSIIPNPNKFVKSIDFKPTNSLTVIFALTSVPNGISNISPTAVAGSNQSITLPTNSITLNGSGIDSDGTIASYSWTKVSGPSTYTISNSSSATTSVKGLITGIYVFKLTVTDDQGATGTGSVTITVNPAANIAPTASAGSNQSITLPTNSITLNGNGIDSDGTIASYSWTKVSGPSTYTISNSSSATTSVKGLIAGNYVFKLTVNDNQGATAADSLTITVNPAANIPPTASAGSNQTITLPTNTVTLSGSGIDSDGTIASYQWTKVSGPSSYTISNASSATTSVKGLIVGNYVFKLTVTDNQGATAADSLTITVNPAANIPPSATAGSSQTITLPTNTVTLTGSGTDSDGTIGSYQWTKVSGPSSYTISNASSATTSVKGLVAGNYVFKLTVTDNQGATAADSLTIRVNPAANIPPTASAGSSQTITLPTDTVTLIGTGTDSDGTIASYQWTKVSGPSRFTISNASSATTSVKGLTAGIYVFKLTVMDNQGASTADSLTITVNPAANIPPTASAGSNQTITLPTNTVTLNGSGKDADGTIASYQWTKVSGPSSYTINTTSSATTSVKGLIAGIYVFKLTVTDDQGATAADNLTITVNLAANIPPTATAGSNQTITLPTNTVTLSGSGKDSDGSISSYSWTKISGPSSFSIKNSSSATSQVSGLVQGVYEFELKVIDDKGAIGKDTIQITVNVAKNLSPTANAGLNQSITLPTNSITLNGSGVDSDGSIAAYLWTKISGPTAYIIANPSSATSKVSGLVEGVYQFELKVTDNKGAVGTDTMQLTVNKNNVIVTIPNVAPTVDAGNDTTALSPVNSIVLNGSANDTDGKITGYLWTQLSGPSGSTILPNNTASTTISSLIAGTYEFELKVTDNAGGEARDTVRVTIALGRTAQDNLTGLKVYPNPVHNMANVELNTQADNSRVTIRITDISGNMVYQKEFVSTTKDVKKQIDMSSLGKGTYVITVYVDGVVKESAKVVKM